MENALKQALIPLVKKLDKDDDHPYLTYEDVPVLKEIDALLIANKEEDKETLFVAAVGYRILADGYATMGRFSVSAAYCFESIKIMKKSFDLYGERHSEANDMLYKLLRDRNYYVDDDCEDALPYLEGLIEREEITKLYEQRKKSRRMLKHDPVEMSEAYLKVIDEVERKIDENRTMEGMGSCFEIWGLKEEYLAEKGIYWRSPALLNPRVRFD